MESALFFLDRCDGGVQPVGFRSRTLTTAEKNYSQLERESLALAFAVTKFRDYLLGRDFTLVANHKSLVELSWQSGAGDGSSQDSTVGCHSGVYSYGIEYQAGTSNANADAMSRISLLVDKKNCSRSSQKLLLL